MDNKDEDGAVSRLGVALNELTNSKHQDPCGTTTEIYPAKSPPCNGTDRFIFCEQ